jgi:hypothetical protein
MNPVRVQRKRTKGWRMPENTVYVGRGTIWGNPFVLNDRSGLAREPAIHNQGKSWEYEGRVSAAGTRHDYFHSSGKITPVTVRYMTREELVLCYRSYVTGGEWPCDWKRHDKSPDIRANLAGKNLACWCRLDQPCHADVLLEIANP